MIHMTFNTISSDFFQTKVNLALINSSTDFLVNCSSMSFSTSAVALYDQSLYIWRGKMRAQFQNLNWTNISKGLVDNQCSSLKSFQSRFRIKFLGLKYNSIGYFKTQKQCWNCGKIDVFNRSRTRFFEYRSVAGRLNLRAFSLIFINANFFTFFDNTLFWKKNTFSIKNGPT